MTGDTDLPRRALRSSYDYSIQTEVCAPARVLPVVMWHRTLSDLFDSDSPPFRTTYILVIRATSLTETLGGIITVLEYGFYLFLDSRQTGSSSPCHFQLQKHRQIMLPLELRSVTSTMRSRQERRRFDIRNIDPVARIGIKRGFHELCEGNIFHPITFLS